MSTTLARAGAVALCAIFIMAAAAAVFQQWRREEKAPEGPPPGSETPYATVEDAVFGRLIPDKEYTFEGAHVALEYDVVDPDEFYVVGMTQRVFGLDDGTGLAVILLRYGYVPPDEPDPCGFLDTIAEGAAIAVTGAVLEPLSTMELGFEVTSPLPRTRALVYALGAGAVAPA